MGRYQKDINNNKASQEAKEEGIRNTIRTKQIRIYSTLDLENKMHHRLNLLAVFWLFHIEPSFAGWTNGQPTNQTFSIQHIHTIFLPFFFGGFTGWQRSIINSVYTHLLGKYTGGNGPPDLDLAMPLFDAKKREAATLACRCLFPQNGNLLGGSRGF